MAPKPNEIYSWDIHHTQSEELSSQLLAKICVSEKINKWQITLHADNGGPIKRAAILATMQMLGVVPSISRPSVSDDNPYSESLFKTLKYCPIFPENPFETIEKSKEWMVKFMILQSKKIQTDGPEELEIGSQL